MARRSGWGDPDRRGKGRCGLVAGSGLARSGGRGRRGGPDSGLRLLIVFMVRGPHVSPYVPAAVQLTPPTDDR